MRELNTIKSIPRFIQLPTLDTYVKNLNPLVMFLLCQQELYNNIPTETKVVHLIGALQNVDVGEDGRQTAAVLLRRLLSAEFFEFFPKLPMEQQAALREQLLLILQMELSQQLRRKVC